MNVKKAIYYLWTYPLMQNLYKTASDIGVQDTAS